MSQHPRLDVGDVFAVPLDDELVGYGQIVRRWGSSGGHFYFALFEGCYRRDESPDLRLVLSQPVAILALSMDPLLVHERWRVVGRESIDRDSLPWPAYKLGVMPPGTFEVVDYTGERRRPATDKEVKALPFRTVVAPIRLERALQALCGYGEWKDAYEALRPVPKCMTSASLIGLDRSRT